MNHSLAPQQPLLAHPIRRVAMLSVHTHPFAQPGVGDAGGMNVYIKSTARELARLGIHVDIFTRATRSSDPEELEIEPGITVRHIQAGPYGALSKNELSLQLCHFYAELLRVQAHQLPHTYDVIHAHYWISGVVGLSLQKSWNVPLIFTAHTLAKVKNRHLAPGDRPEPDDRVRGEEMIVCGAQRCIVNTVHEREDICSLYGLEPSHVDIAVPGADTSIFYPRPQEVCKQVKDELGIASGAFLVGFFGRIQPLKAPEVLVEAVAHTIREGYCVELLIVGGRSGQASSPDVHHLVQKLGISDRVHFLDPQPPEKLAELYSACDVVGMPSRSESFGLVAVEAQACGTAVIAANVGGLAQAVKNSFSGVLLDTHRVSDWADALQNFWDHPDFLSELSDNASRYARHFTWAKTAQDLVDSYGRAKENREGIARDTVSDGSTTLSNISHNEHVCPC